jgi:hypothetical protein
LSTLVWRCRPSPPRRVSARVSVLPMRRRCRTPVYDDLTCCLTVQRWSRLVS